MVAEIPIVTIYDIPIARIVGSFNEMDGRENFIKVSIIYVGQQTSRISKNYNPNKKITLT